MVGTHIDEIRRSFTRAPIGSWESYLGGGNDMHLGMQLTFREDGTGLMEEWGFDHFYIDPDYQTEPKFEWLPVCDCRVAIIHRGESREISYDFDLTKNEYGNEELRMFEPGLEPDKFGEVGFWVSPFSLVFRNPAEYE